MARFQIISKDGKSVRYEGKPKYVGTYMKPSYLEFSEISSPTPINWEIGDYVDYPRTGMRYRLYSIPQASKNAKRGSFGSAFTYSNVQLFAATKELEIAPFRDLVADDNFIHFSTSPDVATFEDIHGIAGRIQACMDDLYPGRWVIKTSAANSGSVLSEQLSTAKDFALSGGTCLDALSKIYELWQEIGWIHTYSSITGKEEITIGYANEKKSDNITDPFLYGKGKGLTAIKKHHTNKEEFATRLYVYGSERNLPARYYNNQSIANAESVDVRNLMLPLRIWGKTSNLPDARKAFIENADAVAKYGVIPRTHYFDSDEAGADVYPSIEGLTIGEINAYAASSGDDMYAPNPSIYSDSERVDEIKYAEYPGDDGVMNRNGRAYDEISYFATNEEWVRTDIAVNEKSKTLNAFLLASKQFKTKDGKVTFRSHNGVTGYMVDNSQISKATLVFELTDSVTKDKLHTEEHRIELSEIKDGVREFTLPYKMEMSYASNSEVTIYAQIYIKIEFYDAVKSEFFVEYCVNASDCSLEVKANLPKTFHITLKQIGFNINDRASQGEKKAISMKSGMCEGRTFNIQDCRYDSKTDSWDLECVRQQDDTLGILFPNTNNPLAKGDKFVLLNIAMPDVYVFAAMEKLLVEGNKLLARASKYQCNYEPQIDAKVMQESEDEANRPGSDSKPRLLREGMYMEISDQDVIDGETDYILIDSLNIYEDESPIPTYKVTLREKRKVSYKGTPSATSPTSTKSADDSELNIDLSEYATKEYVRSIVNEEGMEAIAHLKDMFYWEDEEHTAIGTDYPFFSKSSITAGGKKEGEEDDPESGGGGITEESDPIFMASPAASITFADIDRWNAGGSGGGPDEDVVIDTEMSDTSTNPVQNKVIKEYVDMHPQYEVIEEIEVPDLPQDPENPEGSVDLEAVKDYIDERIGEIIGDNGIFFWEDDATIGTKMAFFSESSITAGGKKGEENEDNQGGLDIEDLDRYLKDNQYATQPWVKSQGYITTSTLNSSIEGLSNRLAALEKLLDWFEFDEDAQMIKAKFGLYSEGAITAGKKAEEE